MLPVHDLNCVAADVLIPDDVLSITVQARGHAFKVLTRREYASQLAIGGKARLQVKIDIEKFGLCKQIQVSICVISARTYNLYLVSNELHKAYLFQRIRLI